LLRALALSGMLLPALPTPASATTQVEPCAVELIVLGIAQDAGMPQIGNPQDPAWHDPALARLAVSLALVDRRADPDSPRRWLFEATPDLRLQLQRLDRHAPSAGSGLGIAGIFLTHAHIGHYAGLIFLGHESAGAREVPVHAMPRMAEFLRENGPWDQLVRYRNIRIEPLAENIAETLADGIQVMPQRVPHRDEYSETVGYSIRGPEQSVYFLPDIDSFERWESDFDIRIEDVIAAHDVVYLDATFHDDQELPGRDMSAIPHPRISTSMDRFDALPEAERAKVRFIHLNHSNPARYPDSAQSRAIGERGYSVAQEGEVVCLGGSAR
jgi:pyrroloquinoline quinone biosynthesis protein B